MKGAIEYLYHDNTIKDKAAKLEEFMKKLSKEIAKAKNVIEGMKLFVSQCDEIKDKAATFEEMIQRALTFIEHDSLENAKEVINEAMTYLGNDDDVKEL
ncbi:hypothetical protein ACFX1X_027397 [Malus domestica]